MHSRAGTNPCCDRTPARTSKPRFLISCPSVAPPLACPTETERKRHAWRVSDEVVSRSRGNRRPTHTGRFLQGENGNPPDQIARK
jgi:hypothetical protein